MLETQHAGTVRQGAGVRLLDDVALLVQHLEHTLAGRHRALVLANPHPDRAHRQHQQRQVRVHGEELAQRDLAVHDLIAADQQHAGDRDAGQRRHGRHVGGLQAGRAQRLAEDALRAGAKAVGLVLLLGKGLHHAHADHVLLGSRGDVGDPLLHLLQHRVADPRVAVGHEGQHRRDRERDQRQLHAHQRHHHQHADDGEHVLGEEDQAIAEEHPHGLHVDGRARQQLPGLVAVEEAVGEPLQVAVHAVSQVVLDRQREPARQPPPEQHDHALDDAEAMISASRCRSASGRSPAVRGVDHLAGQVGDQSARPPACRRRAPPRRSPAAVRCQKPSRRRKVDIRPA